MPMRDPSKATFAELGVRLRDLRQRVGRTMSDVASELGWSISKVSRIESGHTRVGSRDLDRLLLLYGAGPDERAAAKDLAERLRTRLPATALAVPNILDRFAQLEHRASDISVFGLVVIPGLLQTPEYAAAVIRVFPSETADYARPRIEARLARQALLGRVPPPRLTIVLDEAALRRPVGGGTVMRRQMLRLIELGERPETEIRVLPYSVGGHPGMSGSFSILSFDDGTADCVLSDGMTGGVLYGKPTEVALYQTCYAVLLERSLAAEPSAAFISDLAVGEHSG